MHSQKGKVNWVSLRNGTAAGPPALHARDAGSAITGLIPLGLAQLYFCSHIVPPCCKQA